ncbi:helix-turn-helix transcriptional regulator [Desulfoluna spongiiphila]|uniref:PAS fold-containing protein n=1 Tax=Desulfoluna spongiiphila TaxID=419481 RepID=A0A1G5AFM5_9BACT|nr:helix-turn-helix transcriptional regulator [Desulfoluna spongiiphila]SCX76686.1 PAS fold-containing protein [Desulfoluna spongiiphila]
MDELDALRKENAQLKQQLEESSRLIKGLPDLMFTLSREGVFMDYAAMGLPLYRSPEGFMGKSVHEVLPEALARQITTACEAAVGTGERQTLEYSLVLEGDEHHFEARMMRCCQGEGVVAFVRDVTRVALVEEALRNREKELERKTVGLEEMNTALEVLLKKRSRDKKALEEEILFTIREMIHPWIEKLKGTRLGSRQMAYLEVVENNLSTIARPLVQTAPSYQLQLTPSEIEITNLIREGKTNKEIADILSLSVKTIETHRKNIRRKLGLTHSKTNLRALLSASLTPSELE